MDFFEHQDRAKRKTALLLFYYILSIALVIGLVYLVFNIVFLEAGLSNVEAFLNLPLFLWIAGITIAIIVFCTLYKMFQLRRGGGALVASSLGGVEVVSNTREIHERRLLNVVEEMAIASGAPVPKIYLLENEDSINAFAAGYTMEGAVIGVTRGALQKLTRDELQGVIAHEFSHILHGDMRLNTQLISTLFGVMALAEMGKIFLRIFNRPNRSSSSRGKNGNLGVFILFSFLLILIGYLGVLIGRLLQSAICREREFLADAAAVQFTRNPHGIAGALKKILQSESASKLQSGAVNTASHLFFSSALSKQWLSLFETHPPLEERILRIDQYAVQEMAQIKGEAEDHQKFKSSDVDTARRNDEERIDKKQASLERDETDLFGAQTISLLANQAATFKKKAIQAHTEATASTGSITLEHLQEACARLKSIDSALYEAAFDSFDARLIIYALLAKENQNIFSAISLTDLEKIALQKFFIQTKSVPVRLKLPLVELCVPALRQLSISQYNLFRKNIQALMEFDQRIDLFEYALYKTLMRQLHAHFESTEIKATRAVFLRIEESVQILFSLLAHSQNNPVQKVFEEGIDEMKWQTKKLILLPYSQINSQKLDEALKVISATQSNTKRKILSACAKMALSEGVSDQEFELLRVISESIGVPMPLLFSQ